MLPIVHIWFKFQVFGVLIFQFVIILVIFGPFFILSKENYREHRKKTNI